MPTTKTAKPQTPFSEQAGGPERGWLNNPRWPTLPQGHNPPRDRVQRDVSDDEKKKAGDIIKRFRETEELARQHDADQRQSDLHRLGDSGRHGFERARLRKEIEACDLQTFLDAQTRLRELKGEAEKVGVTILHRLVASFDAELQQNALRKRLACKVRASPLSTWALGCCTASR